MKNEKRHKGFGVPEGYFDSFEDRLELRLMEEALPKTNGFSVPEGYFENLEVEFPDEINNETGRVIPLFGKRSLYYAAGIAASLLLILSVSGVFHTGDSLEEVPLSAIESYIEESGLDYDSYDIMAMMNEEELGDLTLEEEIISEESLEDYLLNNLDESSPLLIE